MNEIQIHDKTFIPYIHSTSISKRIEELAKQINVDYDGEKIHFIVVLNGAFMFASDLIKQINCDCEIHFIRFQSYAGTESTGEISNLLGLNTKLTDKHVIIIEDIVDTGQTIDEVYRLIQKDLPKSIKVSTLLYKKEAHKGKISPNYCAFEIENKFVIGFGLDYDGEGRNLDALFQIKL